MFCARCVTENEYIKQKEIRQKEENRLKEKDQKE